MRAVAHWEPALCMAVLLVDQATKAVQPAGAFRVNTGGPAILPSALGDALWGSPALGAACDVLDAVLLLVALALTRRLSSATHRLAATAVLAGLGSNLADRLGATSLFHPGLSRGAIDWIPVPLWPTALTNLADIAVGLGILALGHRPLLRAALAVRARLRTAMQVMDQAVPGRPSTTSVLRKIRTPSAGILAVGAHGSPVSRSTPFMLISAGTAAWLMAAGALKSPLSTMPRRASARVASNSRPTSWP